MSYFWNYKNILKTTGQIIFYSSFTYLIPIILSLFYKEGFAITNTYILLFLLTLVFGLLLFKFIPKKNMFGITMVQSLITVSFVWLVYTFFASLPFHFISHLSLLNSYFESMSSLTTTGLTMYHSVPVLKSLVFWRSFLSWIGGLGIILLTYFGLTKSFSSTKLVSAEGHERLRPSIKKTVIDMWLIYLTLTTIGIVLLSVFGMSLFDAFNYSMSAISTTGTQSNALGLGVIGSPAINLILILIMILGATSFILHFNFFKKKSIMVYLKSKQFISMLLIIFVAFILIFIKLKSQYSINIVLLNVVSMVTCGGFTTLAPNQLLGFGPFVFLIFIIIMFIGGSTNSTTGGIKVDRFILFIKSIFWKIKQSTLPNIAYFPKRYNGHIVEDSEIKSIYFLILIYLLFIIFGVLILTFYGYSINSSAFEVISAQSNVGLTVGVTSATMPWIPRLMLIINMWVGRLEILPLFALIGILFRGKHY